MKMAGYTGMERIAAAMMWQYADVVPAVPALGNYCARNAGFTIRDFLTKVEKHAKSIIQAYEMFQPDSIAVGGDAFVDAEALGAEVEFPEDATSHLRSFVLEDKAHLGKLIMPQPERHARLCWYLEACERVRSGLDDTGVAVGTGATGPWTLATNLRGTERLIYDTVDDPDFVHELLRFTTEWVKVWVPAIQQTGVGVGLGEAAASCGVISPQIYRAFVKPYHQVLVTYFRQRNLPLMLHMCGYINPIMEDVIDTGIASLSIDSPSSLRKLVELSQRRVVIIGNVPTALFAEGTKEQMEAAVKECIDIAAEGSGYILCSGCEIPLNSRKENIDYFMEAAREHGRYL